MAIVTLPIASFADGLVRGEVDLDGATLRVRVARVINDSDYPALIEVFKAGVSVAKVVIPAHSTQSCNLPANIKFVAIPQPNPDEDGPISMGDIEIHCGWPG